MLRKMLFAVALTFSGAVCAHAVTCLEYVGGCGGVAAAPEIDPGSAMAALTLLAGGLAVARGRFRRK